MDTIMPPPSQPYLPLEHSHGSDLWGHTTDSMLEITEHTISMMTPILPDSEDSQESEDAPQAPSKPSCRSRNDQKWESYKDQIRTLYMEEEMTLIETMGILRKQGFNPSERKFKTKLKEWGFNRYIPAKDKLFMLAKAEKRKREEGKDTEFRYGESIVRLERLESFKKRKVSSMEIVSPSAETPYNMSYRTPCNVQTPGQDLPPPYGDEPSDIAKSIGSLPHSWFFDPITSTPYVDDNNPPSLNHNQVHNYALRADEDACDQLTSLPRLAPRPASSNIGNYAATDPSLKDTRVTFEILKEIGPYLKTFWMTPQEFGLIPPGFLDTWDIETRTTDHLAARTLLDGILRYAEEPDWELHLLEGYIFVFLSKFRYERNSKYEFSPLFSLHSSYYTLTTFCEKHIGKDKRATSLCIWRLAILSLELGKYEQAQSSFSRALQLFRKAGDSQQGCTYHKAMALIFTELGFWEDATRHLLSAITFTCASGFHYFQLESETKDTLELLQIAEERFSDVKPEQSTPETHESIAQIISSISCLWTSIRKLWSETRQEDLEELWLGYSRLSAEFSRIPEFQKNAEALFIAILPRLHKINIWPLAKTKAFVLHIDRYYREERWKDCFDLISSCHEHSIAVGMAWCRHKDSTVDTKLLEDLEGLLSKVKDHPRARPTATANQIENAQKLEIECWDHHTVLAINFLNVDLS